MKAGIGKSVVLVGLVTLGLGLGGCQKVRGYQGYIIDSTLMDSVQAGVDNRASVEKTLGRPTFFGQFNAADWYYVARQTRQYAFTNPKASEQTVMRIQFDGAGNVARIDKAGAERIASIKPSGDKTPTLGKSRSFFEDLFGNIGQVGTVGQGGGTADNPDQ
jgi:outer membrane protein assembly factor BamE (lipoprotein component of BamABCDE complex)